LYIGKNLIFDFEKPCFILQKILVSKRTDKGFCNKSHPLATRPRLKNGGRNSLRPPRICRVKFYYQLFTAHRTSGKTGIVEHAPAKILLEL
jgi:hypothetical protein